MNTELSLLMLTQYSCNSDLVQNVDGSQRATPRRKSTLMSSACNWSATGVVDSPSRRRATTLFDMDDGCQMLVSYDAPAPPPTRPRRENATAAPQQCTTTTALEDDQRPNSQRQHPAATEPELHRQEEEHHRDLPAVASSSAVAAASKSRDRESEQETGGTENVRGSVARTETPLYGQRAVTTSRQHQKGRDQSVPTAASKIARRQSLGPVRPSKTSAVGHPGADTSVGEGPAGSSGVSRTDAGRSKKAETARSVSTSRRSSLMNATASSLAKRSEHGANSQAPNDNGDSSFTASLTSKIAKLIKGGSKPAASKDTAAAATAPATDDNRRLSLDARKRPRTGLVSVTPKPRDRRKLEAGPPAELGQSANVGQVHSVTSSTRGRATGRGQSSTASVQGSQRPSANVTKSSSTISLRSDAAKKNQLIQKSEGHVAEQLSKEVADRTVKSVQSTTSPSPVTSPYSPELGYNSVAVGTSTTRRCYTERRKKWTKSKCTEETFVVTSIFQLAKRVNSKSTALLGVVRDGYRRDDENSGSSSMKDEHSPDQHHHHQQQQQQGHSTPVDNCLPEWKSSDPYMAGILRHLRKADQHLDDMQKALAVSAADQPQDSEQEYSIKSAITNASLT